MTKSLTLCGALLALAALTSTADAGVLGGLTSPKRTSQFSYYPDGWKHHPHYIPQGGSSEPPLACRGRPGGC
jgi:hypothetical protein